MDYILKFDKYFKDYKVNVLQYEHESGANIIFLKNSDKHLSFLASMRTIPKNNNGIPHILEHIILNGSKNYDVDDTFIELTNSSIFSYLNAITFNDKTVFPMATYNENEFKKILDVYLDAIFNPLLKKSSFLQEGINFTQNNNIPNGIVFNEMLGMYENPIYILKRESYKILFKNNPLQFDSAGTPEKLVNVKYNDIIDYYKNNYTLPNCNLFFYGDIDENYYLEYLKIFFNNLNKNKSKKYYNKYIDNEAIYPKQIKSFCHGDDNKLISATFFIGKTTEPIKILLIDILVKIFQTISANYSFDVNIQFDHDDYYGTVTFIIENTKSEVLHPDKILAKMFEEVKLKYIEQILNKKRFELINEDYGYKSRGLGLIFLILNSVIYKKNEFDFLNSYSLLNKIQTDEIYSAIKKYFIFNKNVVYNNLVISKDYKTNLKKVEEKIIKMEQIDFSTIKNHNINQNHANKFTISNKHINNNFIINNLTEYQNVYLMPILDDKIFYLKIHFSIKHLKPEQLYFLGILEYILQKNDDFPLKHAFNYFGEFYIDKDIFIDKKNNVSYEFLTLNIKGFITDLPGITNICHSVLYDKNLQNIENITSIIREIKIDLENKLQNNPLEFGTNKAKSKFYPEYDRLDKIEFYDFYIFIQNIIKYKIDSDYLIENIKDMYKKVFNINNVLCSVAINLQNIHKLDDFTKNINNDKCKFNYRPNTNYKNKHMILNKLKYNNFTNIGYISDIPSYGLYTMSYIIENEYFYKDIRVKGGAYGYGAVIQHYNDLLCYSFNDPNTISTQKIFEKSFDFIKDLGDIDKNKFMIGALNKITKPKHLSKQFDDCVLDYFENRNINIIIEEILHLDLKKINYDNLSVTNTNSVFISL